MSRVPWGRSDFGEFMNASYFYIYTRNVQKRKVCALWARAFLPVWGFLKGWEGAQKTKTTQARMPVPQKERFQVIRFPALFTTGMHGTEHRNRELRTLGLSAPR